MANRDHTRMRPTPGTAGDLRAWITLQPAHYCMGEHPEHCRSCRTHGRDNHGRGAVTMAFCLAGDDFGVSWPVYTGWGHSADPYSGYSQLGIQRQAHWEPMANAVFTHSTRPLYDGHEQSFGGCDVLDGGRCYTTRSDPAGQIAWEKLTDDGDEAVWAWLAACFHDELRDRAGYEQKRSVT